jgi:tRNA G10  N-methylase Trm11
MPAEYTLSTGFLRLHTMGGPRSFTLELATGLVGGFSFTGDTVLDPFSWSGTTMIAPLRTGRNRIGVEIDPEYCRMAARYLEAENPDLFSSSKLIFEKATTEHACLVREDQEVYQVRPAKK